MAKRADYSKLGMKILAWLATVVGALGLIEGAIAIVMLPSEFINTLAFVGHSDSAARATVHDLKLQLHLMVWSMPLAVIYTWSGISVLRLTPRGHNWLEFSAWVYLADRVATYIWMTMGAMTGTIPNTNDPATNALPSDWESILLRAAGHMGWILSVAVTAGALYFVRRKATRKYYKKEAA